ncbi:serine protease 40-like [Apodemus sylvaticus]|uniref:serine protease 40-like n=1 Tax=Apodemus sylvaticus TaxID=10129 RepID=UPI002244AAEF|nr:serine protease 40-like [Apodemus sylvaticus]
MWGARAQQSGLGGFGASLLAALLGLSFLSQHARAAEPTNVTNPANQTTQTMKSTLSEVCGKTKFQGKIYGGQIAGAERWPWQASLRLYGRHVCGAVLIDKNWVASAAHCFQRSRNPGDYQVMLGYTDLRSPTRYSKRMAVQKVIIHTDYDRLHPQGSDIVLLQLRSSVEYSSHILPACVPDKGIKIPKEKACWTSGWGHLREDVRIPLPTKLHEAELIIMNNEQCKGFFPPPAPGSGRTYYIYDDMVCAADYNMTKSICAGDSGGPLVCLLEDSWYVIGLTSWSASCEEPLVTPSVFARVSYFEKWIKENKKASSSSKPPHSPKPPNHSKPPHQQRLPGNPDSPENENPQESNKDQGAVVKPTIYTALVLSQALLQQLI